MALRQEYGTQARVWHSGKVSLVPELSSGFGSGCRLKLGPNPNPNPNPNPDPNPNANPNQIQVQSGKSSIRNYSMVCATTLAVPGDVQVMFRLSLNLLEIRVFSMKFWREGTVSHPVASQSIIR